MARRLLGKIDWSCYEIATGSAVELGSVLARLLVSSSVSEASSAWEQIEESVFSQGIIYSAAEPTVSVMLAALLDQQPPWRSGRIMDLVFFIVSGVSVRDSALRGRCHDRAREGLWLLTSWALGHDGWERENALEVIEVIAPDRADLIRSAISA